MTRVGIRCKCNRDERMVVVVVVVYVFTNRAYKAKFAGAFAFH